MTDAHEDTPSEEHERIAFQPDYDKYGVATSEDSTVILRIDSDKHLFERVGLVSRRQTEITLKRHVDGESVDDAGSFETLFLVNERNLNHNFETRLLS